MKVLHFIHALHGGGAERQLTVLANHLDGEGLEFAVFCVDASLNHIDNPYCKTMPIKDRANYPWGMYQEASDAIDDYQPDIVHCWLPPSVSAPALVAAKVKGVKTVASYRNKKIFESWIRLPEYLSTLFCADSIVSNNSPEQSSYLFKKLFEHKNGVVIPNAVSVDASYRIERRSREENSVFTFLFVGRITKQKNWQTLLSALSQLKVMNKWQLLVCGKGEDEDAFKDMAAQLGLSDNIQMLGYLPDVYSVMVSADLLILPSWYEGMPNVVMESLSIGVPAVVSSIPAHESLFHRDSGVCFFCPADHLKLASQLSDIADGKIDINKLSESGLKFVDDFTPQKMLRRYQDYYSGLLT